MRLREREIDRSRARHAQTKTAKFREWVCPECDYFEEAEEAEEQEG